MAETGFQRGSLSPIYYFENAVGHIVMPVYDAGQPWQARKVFEARFATTGYVWREAGTLSQVEDLEKRLIRQEAFKTSLQKAKWAGEQQRIEKLVRGNLRQRMTSSDCSPFERDFIKAYFELRETKRQKYREFLDNRNSYLWSLQMDSGTKIDDRMPSQPGEFWRPD